MCGDATNPDDITKLIGKDTINLILTDPPYGMKTQSKDGVVGDKRYKDLSKSGVIHAGSPLIRAKEYPLLIGDNSQETARLNYELIKDLTRYKIIWGGQYFAHFLPINGGWIFWDKQNSGITYSDGELAWRSWGRKVKRYIHKWNGIIRAGSRKLNLKSRIHPTQKPVELHMKILEDYSKQGDTVLDCFAGSGTTLIACEETGRKCLTMEINPEYCDVIIDRYNKLKETNN